MPRQRFRRAYIPVLIPKDEGPNWLAIVVIVVLLAIAGLIAGVCQVGTGTPEAPVYNLPAPTG